ncbi:restriction endonuclease subunit S [Gluconobacter thailandicus]|uniref:restriction endonuclease subunit S n=1 Tax=Gluconobacter thailandicus TaxID=257438 RepID=UPI000776E4FD|nr:restriction endonuclease subunit S [Gluconobacter thailandicus]KXV33633.1 restriction endonuclease subunit S [Gluconobacter thailandicus]
MTIATSFAKHEVVRDSSTEWLGAVPSDWAVKKMKFLFRDHSRKGMPDAELLSVTQNQGVVPRTWVENRMVMPSGNLESFKFIEEGDFAISLRSFEGGLEYCHHDGIISPAYTVLKRRSEDLLPAYYRYLFKSTAFISELQTSVVGIREGKNISFEELSYSLIPIPPLPEQRAIAAFLDGKCATIDEAVRIKEEQIRLLAERRQILIQQAVTRGLSADAPMKDSGIDWIGQIPAHWEVKRLKHLSEIFRGKFTHRPRNDPRLYDGEYPFFQTGDVARAGMFLSEYRQTLNEAGLRVSTLIPKGTILITIAANIGDVTILDIDGCFPDSVVGFKPRPEIERDFLYYSMSAMKTIFMNNSIANAQANLNVDRIGGITVCLPPKAEQNVIMEYVQMANEKTDRAIGVKESQITALREYKTSLINAAVTGKIKVL